VCLWCWRRVPCLFSVDVRFWYQPAKQQSLLLGRDDFFPADVFLKVCQLFEIMWCETSFVLNGVHVRGCWTRCEYREIQAHMRILWAECRTMSKFKWLTNLLKVWQFWYVRLALANQNCMHEEIKSRLNLGYTYFSLIQNLFSSSFLHKNIKIKIYRQTYNLVFWLIWLQNLFSHVKGRRALVKVVKE
jgi:hypothetical protein